MKTKLAIFVIIAFLLPACGAGTPAPVTRAPTATQPPTDIPTQTPLLTFIPLGPTSPPSPTAVPLYPTASVVKSNAVAFISYDKYYNYSLWIVNTDGSGERKITDLEKNVEWVSTYLLRWSPDGKWIGYISGDDLWIISPDGSTKRKILSIQDTDKKIVRQYAWSPDSTKIAYALALNWGDFTEIKTGLLDLTTGENSDLSIYQSPATITLSWSPNGNYLLFNKDSSFWLYEFSTHKIVKEIKSTEACWTTWHDGLAWSSNGKWFYTTHHSNGRYAINWICIGGLDGSNRKIGAEGTSSTPIWDKTRDFLYFVTRKSNPDSDPNLKINEQLMRYNVRTQRLESLLSLREQQTYGYIQSVSISPNKGALLLQSQFSKTKFDLVFVDIKSLTTTKFTVDFENLKIPFTYAYFLETAWSPDSQNLILLAGDVCSPHACIEQYGSFYTLNIKTGETNIFSGIHVVDKWITYPIATTP